MYQAAVVLDIPCCLYLLRLRCAVNLYVRPGQDIEGFT